VSDPTKLVYLRDNLGFTRFPDRVGRVIIDGVVVIVILNQSLFFLPISHISRIPSYGPHPTLLNGINV